MSKVLRKAIILVLLITAMAGIAGFFYGKLYLTGKEVNWWLPENLSDRDAFIIVGCMHNFSYEGGLIALITALVYIFKTKASSKLEQKS